MKSIAIMILGLLFIQNLYADFDFGDTFADMKDTAISTKLKAKESVASMQTSGKKNSIKVSKVALVIGNQHYKNHAGLQNPIADAKLIRDTLTDMGFDVMEAYDTKLYTLSEVLDKFITKAKKAQIAVVYYAGHGIGLGSANYIIPIGASNLSVDNLGRKLMSLNELKGAVAKAQGFGAVFFDACRNSFFSGSIAGLSSGRGSRALVQPHVRRGQNILVSFSTQAGSIAKDDVNNGSHSPYALALSEKLSKRSDIRLVMGSVRSRVSTLTNYAQMPVDENQLDGNEHCLVGAYGKHTKVPDNSAALAKLKAENERLRKKKEEKVTPVVVTSKSSKWFSPSRSVCEGNGGSIQQGICYAKWNEANNVCHASNAALPDIKALMDVVSNCGGYISRDVQSTEANANISNTKYQDCYQNMGFESKHYWSKNNYSGNPKKAWGIYFHAGTKSYLSKSNERYVRCVEKKVASIDISTVKLSSVTEEKASIKAKVKNGILKVKFVFAGLSLNKKCTPENFIAHIYAIVEGKVIFDASTSQYIGLNPVFKFSYKAKNNIKNKMITVVWVDNKNRMFKASKRIK